MEKLIKDNLLYIVLVVVLLFGSVVFIGQKVVATYSTFGDLDQTKKSVEQSKIKLEQIREEKQREKIEKSKKSAIKSGKKIYEVSSQQFSPEASFGIMFENILANATSSGLRIRSIDYNYKPSNDKILMTNTAGYNACELSFTTVSNYSQLQNFFKNLAKESYLSSLYEVYIEPYDRDKTILIARFKVRIYTKTI